MEDFFFHFFFLFYQITSTNMKYIPRHVPPTQEKNSVKQQVTFFFFTNILTISLQLKKMVIVWVFEILIAWIKTWDDFDKFDFLNIRDRWSLWSLYFWALLNYHSSTMECEESSQSRSIIERFRPGITCQEMSSRQIP